MDTSLNELRTRIGTIDREIVAALAQRSQFGSHAPMFPAPRAAATDEPLTAGVRADYARLVTEKLCALASNAGDETACEAADRTLIAAVLRRLRIVLEIARAKAAGQAPRFQALISTRNAAGLEKAITQPAVEEQVVARAVSLARELHPAHVPADFPDRVASIYREWIIPLARRVQVEALLAGK